MTATAPRNAFITASYGPDFERCRLLCETMDHHATNWSTHYLLVSSADLKQFRALEGPRRTIVDERDILPSWLRRVKDPLSGFRRDLWLHPYGLPLRGWHVQQLRRIALADHVDDDAMIAVDSDVAFVSAYDARSEWASDGTLRLYRVEGAMSLEDHVEQRIWSANAGAALGLPAGPGANDYINTLIAWRTSTVRAMMRHIENIHHVTSFARHLARRRRFSECTIYGRYVDEVLSLEGHHADDRALCRVLWFPPGADFAGLEAFIAERDAHQVAVGLQSFIGLDMQAIRKAVSR